MESKDVEQLVDSTVSFLDKYTDVVMAYLVHFIFAIVIFIIGRLLANFVARSVQRLLVKRHIEATLVTFIGVVIKYAIMIFTFIAVLGQLGVQTTSIVAAVGAAGLAIGLALQGSLSNFAAGVLLVIFRPLKVGELVDVGVLGTVKAVHIFSSAIETPDGNMVIIPNSKVIANNIINYSRDPLRRVDIVVGVDYSAPLDKVRDTLSQAIDNTDNILPDQLSTIRVDELASSSVNFKVTVWTLNENYGEVRANLLANIKLALDEQQISIPYPTMDLKINSANGMLQ